MIRLFGVFLAAFLFACPVLAADYYISNAGSGSSCTIGSPCDQIADLNALSLNPNDTLNFNCGDEFSDDGLDLSDSGTSGNPIILQAGGADCPGTAPILRNSDSEGGVGGDWSDIGSDRWTRTITATAKQVLFDESGSLTMGVIAATQAAVTEFPEWFQSGSTLTVYSTSNPASAYTDVRVVSDSGWDTSVIRVDTDYITIDGLDIREGRDVGVRFVAADNGIIQNTEVSFSYGACIRTATASSNITIDTVDSHDCGSWDIAGDQDSAGRCLDFAGGETGITVLDTDTWNCSSSALSVESAGASNLDVDNFTAHSFGGYGIDIKGRTGHTIDNVDVDGGAFQEVGHVAEGTHSLGGIIVRAIVAAGGDSDVVIQDSYIRGGDQSITIGGASNDGAVDVTSRRNFYGSSSDTGAHTGAVLQIGDGGETGAVDYSLTSESDIYYSTDSNATTTKGILDINRGDDISFSNCAIWDQRTNGDYAVKQDADVAADQLVSFTMQNCSITSDNGIPLHYETTGATFDIDTLHFERDGTVDFIEADGTQYDESDIPTTYNSSEAEATGTHVTGPANFAGTTYDGTMPRAPTTTFMPDVGSPLIGAGVSGVTPTLDWIGAPYNPTTPNIGARSQRIQIKAKKDKPTKTAMACECAVDDIRNSRFILACECIQ